MCPSHLPEPSSPAYVTAASDEIVRILNASRGPGVRAVHQLSADAA